MIRAVLAILVVVTCDACGGVRMPRPESRPATFQADGIFAGAAYADITPPPGLGLFGHGPASRVSEGVGQRLRCAAFVLLSNVDGRKEVVSLVPCELSQPSLLVQREIAARLADGAPPGCPVNVSAAVSAEAARQIPLGADRILMSATHTHAAPGHFFTGQSMTGLASGRLVGFDRHVVRLLADRIACAVHRARVDALQSSQRGESALLRWSTRDVFGLSTNRSFAAFRRNRSLPAAMRQAFANQSLVSEFGEAGVAIDPQIAVLRIDRRMSSGHVEALGLLATFGVHPTVIENHQTLYHGDTFGFASRSLEGWLGQDQAIRNAARGNETQRPVVVGIANGAEGDASPRVHRRGHAAAREHGEKLAHAIFEGWNEAGESSPAQSIRSVYQELYFPGAALSDGRQLCNVPELGAVFAGGASDNPSDLRLIPSLNPGHQTDVDRPCHGRRLPIQLPLRSRLNPGQDVPAWAPIQIVAIGNGAFASIPIEATAAAGVRLRQALLDALKRVLPDDEMEHVALIGLAHEYMQYGATAEEYAHQLYEGASTLYGPHTMPFLRERLVELADSLSDRTPSTAEVRVLEDQASRDRPCPVREGPPMHRAVNTVGCVDLHQVHSTVLDPGTFRQAVPAFVVDQISPVESRIGADGDLEYALSFRGSSPVSLVDQNAIRLSVRARTRGASPVEQPFEDDQGAHISLRYALDGPTGIHNYEAVWRPGVARRWMCDLAFVFEIQTQETMVSDPFLLRCRSGER